jgi:ABC-type transport system involved in multi-copper enzyme maturation permease subunit
MARPLLYDIRKAFLSKTVLISMILLIGSSFFLVSSFSATTTPIQVPNTEVLSWYDSSGTYHFLAFTSNQYGQPVSGVTIQINFTYSPYPPRANSSSYPRYGTPPVSTNSTGEAVLTLSVPPSDINLVNENYSVSLQTTQPNGLSNGGLLGYPYTHGNYGKTTANGSSSAFSPVGLGQVVILVGPGLISAVTDPSNSLKSDIKVTWAGPYGSVPNGYSLYYKFINGTCYISQAPVCGYVSSQGDLGESNMTFLSNMTTYNQIFTPPQLEPNLGNNSEIALGLFYPNGTAVTPTLYYLINQIYPTPQRITLEQSNQAVITFLTEIFGAFIPLIAIIGSYNSYGKDRISGVLESVLVQPISRRGLSISRFVSTFAGMAIAISISMGVVEAIVCYYTRSAFNSAILLASMGAYFVELGAFIGLMMLLSRVIKSSGLLIGIGIVWLFLVFDLFWNMLIQAATSISGAGFGTGYFTYAIATDFLNPAQFVQLVVIYLTSYSNWFGFISPAQYGITIPSLAATGVLWVTLPLAGFLYLATKRD